MCFLRFFLFITVELSPPYRNFACSVPSLCKLAVQIEATSSSAKEPFGGRASTDVYNNMALFLTE